MQKRIAVKKAKSLLSFVYTWTNRCKKSLTIQFNGLMLVAFQLAPLVSESLPVVREFLTPEIYKWLFLAVVAVNILLRFKTKEPLANK